MTASRRVLAAVFAAVFATVLAACLGLPRAAAGTGAQPLVVGSKAFAESHVLAEICARLLEDRGFPVRHKRGLGGTLVTYEALRAGDIDLYPEYSGTLARSDLPPAARRALAELEGAIDPATMRALNRRVSGEGQPARRVAADFLAESGLVAGAAEQAVSPRGAWRRIAGHTLTHLKLTAIALGLACLVAVPLSLALSRLPRASRALVYLCGLLQTVPSLALLALLIPLLGLGQGPAILALFLYSLLPIVRNTITGITSVDPLLRQVASGMGLTRLQQMWLVELPLAMPTLLAGIRTAAVISIGTATLAAFVGAGGLGEPIITGLTLNDHRLILEGAIPAALLAILVELLFELAERALLPAHLRRAGGAAP